MCSEPTRDVGQLTAGRCRRSRRVAEVQGLYLAGDVLERGYNSEDELDTDKTGQHDGRTDGLVSCNAAVAIPEQRIDVSTR